MLEDLEIIEQYDYLNEDDFNVLKEKYAHSVGSYLMNFSSLEHTLNTSIADLVSDRSHLLGYVIVEKLSFQNKIDLWFKLYNQKINVQGHDNIDKLLTEIKLIKKQIVECNIFRNIIAHANWLSLGNNGFVRSKIIVNAEQGIVTFKKYRITPQIISGKILQCLKTTHAIQRFDLLRDHSE